MTKLSASRVIEPGYTTGLTRAVYGIGGSGVGYLLGVRRMVGYLLGAYAMSARHNFCLT